MTKLMFVRASPRGTDSKSIEIAQVYLDALRGENRDLEIDRLDLWEADLPVFDGNKAAAKLNVFLGNDQDVVQQTAWDQIVGIANRFISADRYLFAVPMWNGGVPYRLKQYIDIVHQPGLLFGLKPETGYFGLLENKHATLVLTSGAFAPSFPSPAFGLRSSFHLSARLVESGGHISNRRIALPADAADKRPGRRSRTCQAGRCAPGAGAWPYPTRQVGSGIMRTPVLLAAATAATLATAQVAKATPVESTSAATTYHRVQVDGLGIFYREAGPKDAPTIVLLHGFPSSSREFDTLIPLLATHYHLIAPDFPGFGQSDAPPPSRYTYTFDHLAKTIDDLLETLKINDYSLYLHDYGAPVGFRIILMHPERLHALIIQNGNIYKDGLGTKWAKIAEYWADPNAHPEVVNAFLSFQATEAASYRRHIASRSLQSRHLDR